MKRLRGMSMMVTAGLLLVAGPARAQLEGIPVYFSPKGGTGFTLAGDVGRGINDDSGKNTALAARATLGISAVSLSAGIGTLMLDNADDQITYAGSLAIRLVGGALLPIAVSLQGGVGFVSSELGAFSADRLTIPIGVGFGLNIPSTAFLFEPWIAPRVQISRLTANDESETQATLGLSAGVTLGFAMGLALHAAIDWANLDSSTFTGFTIPSSNPATLGVGLSYTFRLPGVPGL